MDIYRFRLPGFERTYSREVRNRAIVVDLQTRKKKAGDTEEDLKEITELARAAGVHTVASLHAVVQNPSPKYFIREGKLSEIKTDADKTKANILILNQDLTPSQMSHMESYLKMPVIDRTGIILEIFGRRAKSKEGKLQVELAQLFYALPRIGGLGTVMSRLGGGIGTRGPGEQELERDRRKIRRRIQQVKSELKGVEKHRGRLRSGREKKGFLTAAIVGYTNAGKSTLLNALTGADTLVADKLFATLDPKVRLAAAPNMGKLLFVDTVGFIQNLPHSLVESFHATLEEVSQADILIHVLDASNPRIREQKNSVDKVLEEIGAESIPQILILNKADLLDASEKLRLSDIWPEAIMLSAKFKTGISDLIRPLEENVKLKQ